MLAILWTVYVGISILCNFQLCFDPTLMVFYGFIEHVAQLFIIKIVERFYYTTQRNINLARLFINIIYYYNIIALFWFSILKYMSIFSVDKARSGLPLLVAFTPKIIKFLKDVNADTDF